eukprot:TRINITY_DN19441_c0_g1_i1.p1 TRINITY_DN19441_c0_g1~~TRINITY_DN19441_c0_g1_i1.p1  ORF type:complete len:348 (+),score=70.43 TRINITY_DN19441_c0_g1_i1:44-1045(+)
MADSQTSDAEQSPKKAAARLGRCGPRTQGGQDSGPSNGAEVSASSGTSEVQDLQQGLKKMIDDFKKKDMRVFRLPEIDESLECKNVDGRIITYTRSFLLKLWMSTEEGKKARAKARAKQKSEGSWDGWNSRKAGEKGGKGSKGGKQDSWWEKWGSWDAWHSQETREKGAKGSKGGKKSWGREEFAEGKSKPAQQSSERRKGNSTQSSQQAKPGEVSEHQMNAAAATFVPGFGSMPDEYLNAILYNPYMMLPPPLVPPLWHAPEAGDRYVAQDPYGLQLPPPISPLSHQPGALPLVQGPWELEQKTDASATAEASPSPEAISPTHAQSSEAKPR